MANELVSVIVPLYNEEQVIDEMYRQVRETMEKTGQNYEVIMVNDGSRDRTCVKARAIAEKDNHFKLINFSRNFGHQIAITAGMDYSAGDAVVIIDADLQDPPEMIQTMIDKWHEGYDVVYAVREKRKGESLFKSFTAALFYRLLKKLANIDIPLDTGDFRLMSRRVVNALRASKEKHRFVRGMVCWVGYRHIGIPYVRNERFAGETKYPFRKMVRFAIDGITSFSFVPLQIASYFGLLVSAVSFIGILTVIAVKLFTDLALPGWSSQMVITLFLGGVQLTAIGIIGEYVGRIYDEVKQRPLYIVADETGFGPGPEKQGKVYPNGQ